MPYSNLVCSLSRAASLVYKDGCDALRKTINSLLKMKSLFCAKLRTIATYAYLPRPILTLKMSAECSRYRSYAFMGSPRMVTIEFLKRI